MSCFDRTRRGNLLERTFPRTRFKNFDTPKTPFSAKGEEVIPPLPPTIRNPRPANGGPSRMNLVRRRLLFAGLPLRRNKRRCSCTIHLGGCAVGNVLSPHTQEINSCDRVSSGSVGVPTRMPVLPMSNWKTVENGHHPSRWVYQQIKAVERKRRQVRSNSPSVF